ncbi:MAG: S8 family serine peptidase, partial [Pseudomonadales bacterium]
AFDRKLDTLYMIKALQSDPTVAEAAPNYIHTFEQVTPNDPRYPLQWHYPQISLPNAWALSTGNDTIVAVVDSGVLLDHPDLQGQLVPGYDFVNNQPGGNDPGQQPPPVGGSSFHGTHVAGTIAAATNNQLQVAGTAFDARVMPLRVCSVFCSSFATEQAVRYAAGLPNDSGTVPAQPAHVINLSLGRGGPPLSSEQALYDEVRAANIAVVAAAGNDNTSNEFFPAAYNGVIAVSAVDIQRRKAPYSNFGPWIDVAAPGGDLTRDLNADGHPDGVLSTLGDDRSTELQFTTKFLQGTSMAAPHVAGVLALMRAANPGLTTDDITTLLVNGDMTDDLGQPGRDDTFGHGLINANKAVTAAIEAEGDSVDLEPLLTASPARLNFGATRELLNVTLSNAGGGTITVEQPSEDSGGWLEVALTPTDGTLIAELTVERELLAEGPHMATVTFPSTANTVDVRVFIYVADVLDHGVGLQYVLLLDADTFEEVRTTVGRPREDSKFDFKIDDVEPGTYLLLSGSDADNNIFVCELGESCGLYRSIGDPVLIEVDGDDIENLDFVSGYDFSLGSSSTSLPLDKRGVRRDSTKKLKMSP